MSAGGDTATLRFTAPFGRAVRADAAPVQSTQPPSRAALQLALAHWIERKIETGELRDLAHAAEILGVSRARVTQIANLRLLPAGVQERVLTEGAEGSARLARGISEHNDSAQVPPSTLELIAHDVRAGSTGPWKFRRIGDGSAALTGENLEYLAGVVVESARRNRPAPARKELQIEPPRRGTRAP